MQPGAGRGHRHAAPGEQSGEQDRGHPGEHAEQGGRRGERRRIADAQVRRDGAEHRGDEEQRADERRARGVGDDAREEQGGGDDLDEADDRQRRVGQPPAADLGAEAPGNGRSPAVAGPLASWAKPTSGLEPLTPSLRATKRGRKRRHRRGREGH